MMNKPIFCALAFGSVSINPNGHYVPCCGAINFPERTAASDTTTLQKINSTDLKELRKKLISGVWPKECNGCKLTEEIPSDSARTIWNRDLPFPIPISEEVKADDVYLLDLSLGSKCNSKCMMCGPAHSNFWEEEWTTIQYKISDKKGWNTPTTSVYFGNPINITTSDALTLIDTYPNVRFISLIGGEPTIIEEHLVFLKVLVETGRSKNISLSYVTNLTGISDELIDLWQKFEMIQCTVSVDGFGLVNDYIRYPIKWSKVDANLRRYMSLTLSNTKFSIGLSCTLSIYNCLHVDELLQYWYDLKNEFNASGISLYMCRVNTPVESNTNILSSDYRQRATTKLLALKDVTTLKDSGIIDLIISWLEDGLAETHRNNIVKDSIFFITESDKFRNRHIKDFIPELWAELNK